jgi:ribosomal protein S18 acetylase RimI-like enzyme
MMMENTPLVTIEAVQEIDDCLRDTMIAIDEEAFGPGSLNEWSLPPFLNYGRIYLARFNGEPAGIAELMRDWHETDLVYLYGIAVAEEYRGHKVGTDLFRFVLEDLAKFGFKRMRLTVHPDNQWAIHIYESKFGMYKIKLLKNYYGFGEDRWLMEWKAEG